MRTMLLLNSLVDQIISCALAYTYDLVKIYDYVNFRSNILSILQESVDSLLVRIRTINRLEIMSVAKQLNSVQLDGPHYRLDCNLMVVKIKQNLFHAFVNEISNIHFCTLFYI